MHQLRSEPDVRRVSLVKRSTIQRWVFPKSDLKICIAEPSDSFLGVCYGSQDNFSAELVC